MTTETRTTPSVSLKESERKFLEIQAEKAGVSLGRYMRKVALGELPQVSKTGQPGAVSSQELKKLMRDLYGIATNLNQMARVANSTKSLDSEKLGMVEAKIDHVVKLIDSLGPEILKLLK